MMSKREILREIFAKSTEIIEAKTFEYYIRHQGHSYVLECCCELTDAAALFITYDGPPHEIVVPLADPLWHKKLFHDNYRYVAMNNGTEGQGLVFYSRPADPKSMEAKLLGMRQQEWGRLTPAELIFDHNVWDAVADEHEKNQALRE